MKSRASHVDKDNSEKMLILKNGLAGAPFPYQKGIKNNKLGVDKLISTLREVEKELDFQFHSLRRIARSQLLILLKKFIYTNSSEFYLSEIQKLIMYEKGLRQNHDRK